MSTETQNPRSPDQQLHEIEDAVRRLGYPWQTIKVYRDHAKSGRMLRNRPQYQQMMQDIYSQKINPDLILVDTLERFGRVDELPAIRSRLQNQHGVLVLTADSSFADPTSLSGRALGVVETIRATEEGRVKAHNVLRGKRDAIRQGKWPGGAAPLGLKLESVMKEVNGRQEVDYKRPVPDPETFWIIQTLFEKARTTGWGGQRLAKFLTQHPDVPQELKPFNTSTILGMLDNPIYKGELLWEKHSTGIVNDVRVLERNRDDELIRVPNFCEPIVAAELWEEVHLLRLQRAAQHKRRKVRRGDEPDVCIRALGTGVAVNYPFSGLIHCADCGRRMTVFRSGTFRTSSGDDRDYAAYRCPARYGGGCTNCVSIPVDWLREKVLGTFVGHLFPASGTASGPIGSQATGRHQPRWHQELTELIAEELERQSKCRPELQQRIQAEIHVLKDKIQGWTTSLANPTLPALVRAQIEPEFEQALKRKSVLELDLDEEQHRQDLLLLSVHSDEIGARLDQLHEILGNAEATRLNLELSLHIERLDCYGDGRLVMRTCRLGALPEVLGLLQAASPDHSKNDGLSSSQPVALRRRGRLKVLSVPSQDDSDTRALLDFAAEPNRFAGLGEEWFWIDHFQVPRRQSWVNENASTVLKRWQDVEAATGKRPSIVALAREFSVSIPTIRNALAVAQSDKLDQPAERPQVQTRGRSIAEILDEVAELHNRGLPLNRIASTVGASKSSVVRAIDIIYERRGLPRPDLRRKKTA